MIISAPFGNYIQPEGATATLGTFTAERRGGIPNRIWRVAKTVRYYPRLKAWVNRIGLRNPGIDWLVEQVRSGRIDVSNKIVSIHGFDAGDWQRLLGRILDIRPLAMELNISCPNVGHISWPRDLFERAANTGVPVVVKVPPVNYDEMVDRAHDAGIRHFHCCNTLPNPGGGLSGKPLKPLSLQCIRALAQRPYSADLEIIGGGGISEPDDVDDYAREGASHVAIASKLFNPLCLVSDAPIRPLIQRADALLGRP